MKVNVLTAAVSSAALLFAAGAHADGGPGPEEYPPQPAPVAEPAPSRAYTPPPEVSYDWYTSIFAGVAFGDDLGLRAFEEGFPVEVIDLPLETGYLLGWTIGYDYDMPNLFGFSLRPEVELSFRQQDTDLEELDDDIGIGAENISLPNDVLSLLGNLWIDYDFGMATIYGGGGAGIGWADLSVLSVAIETEDFVWQFGGGVNVDLNERVFAGVGYRYFAGDFEEDLTFLGDATNVEYEYRTHEVLGTIGVRF